MKRILLCLLLLAAAPAYADDAAAQALEKEANATVDQAFKDFDAKKYREAAQGFLRAYELTGGRFPKQLKNAAKAFTAGSLFEEAVGVWDRLANLPKAEEPMRKEAREQLVAVRHQWSEQLRTTGDAAHRGKQHRAAADAYVRAFRASGRTRADVLLLAAKDYEAEKRLDDAHLAYEIATALPSAPAEAAKEAGGQMARLLAETLKTPASKTAAEKRAAGQFADAAAQFLLAFDATRERLHLRLAAQCLETADKFDEALATWSRYELHDPTSLLGTDEARSRQKNLRRQKLKNEAKAAAAAGKHAAAGEAWLAMYDVSQERDVVALREAAQSFEAAEQFARARDLWSRLAESPYASDAERAAATERAAEAAKAKPKPVVEVTVEKPKVEPDKVDKTVVIKLPDAPPPAAEERCLSCWILAGGGTAVMIGSATLIGLARSDQSALLQTVQTKDEAGRIAGITQQDAAARQDRNMTLNAMGVSGLVGGVAALASGLVLKWLQPEPKKPARAAALAH